ncbi:MAG: ABC transporter ATP-binding protein [Bacteroidales bacterium]|nr:ABC transporter ATP-binding protein [Bacteroidales bacterium]
MKVRAAIQWFWKGSKGVRRYVMCSSFALFGNVFFSLVFVYASKRMIDIATGRAAGTLTGFALLMGTCVLVQLISSAVSARLEVKGEVLLRNRIRFNLFTHLMDSRLGGRDSLHTGDLLNRMESDVQTVSSLICAVLPATFSSLVRLSGSFVFLLILDWKLALICLAIMPVMILCGSGFAIRMRRMTRDLRETDSQVQAHLQENIQRRSVVSSMGHTAHASDVLDSLQSSLERKTMRRADYSLLWRIAIQCGFSLGYLTAFIWGILGLRSGTVSFGVMTAFLQLVSQIQRPVVELTRQLPQFIHASVSAERLAEITDIPLEERGSAISLGKSVGVRLSDVSFTYPDGGGVVIDGFTHDFKPGSMTAILGETGVGKSTLARLLLALLLPDTGEVTVYAEAKGGAPAMAVKASPRTRCNFVYVPQGNTLLSGTIRDNLRISNPDAGEEQMREALHTACADFVYSLPDGLDTVCAELGTGLSEGQAQRIAIARGLLRPGSVLLLDEPTSSLDSETEAELLTRLSANLSGRTLIIITHRGPAASLCPEQVVIG